MSKSELEESLALHIRACKLPQPDREYLFLEGRRFRFDFAWPQVKVAAECEGATWSGGRHNTGSGIEKDIYKYNEAALLGWLVLRFTSGQITSGYAIGAIERALKMRGG